MAASHLFATAERNNDGFIAQSIRIRRDSAREGESVACRGAPVKRV